MKSTRGQVALSAARLLFRSADHVDALIPTVEALTQDDTVAVRACAANAVTALLNHAAPQALDLAERMFNTDIAVLDADTSENLLAHAVLRDPDRFARTLAAAIAGPEDIAVRAGRVWAVALRHQRLPAGIVTDVCALPAAARRGAVEVFASNVADSVEDLRLVIDDDDPEVQENLATAIRRLGDVPASETEELIGALIESNAFPSTHGQPHVLARAAARRDAGQRHHCLRTRRRDHRSRPRRSIDVQLPNRHPTSQRSCGACTGRETKTPETAASTSSTSSQSSTCTT